jgi:hypothetical protein
MRHHGSTSKRDGRGWLHAAELGVLLAMLAIAFSCWGETGKDDALPDAPKPNANVTAEAAGAGLAAAVTRPPTLPAKPESFWHNSLNRSLVAGDFATRFLDALTTEEAMRDSCRCLKETGEPAFIAKSPALQYSLSLTEAAGVAYAAGKLWKHGHRKLARGVLMLDIVGDGTRGAANNWREMATKGKGGVW